MLLVSRLLLVFVLVVVLIIEDKATEGQNTNGKLSHTEENNRAQTNNKGKGLTNLSITSSKQTNLQASHKTHLIFT
jgi:predicted PurR-regulated permease PerM